MATAIDMISEGLDTIEAKINKGFDEFKVKQAEMADEILQLKQRGGLEPSGITKPNTSLGAKVWKGIEANADLLAKTDKLRLEIKAAGDVTTTSSARTIASGGVGVPSGMAIGCHYAIPTRMIGATSAIEYSRYTGIEGAAAKQSSEGAAKAAVRPTFSLISQGAITIAGYSKISKQALTDSAELQRAIDVTLRRSIATALDSELMTASWGGANGLLAHATAYTSLVYTGLADAVSEAVATMQEAGFVPDTVIMTPADWLAITTATASGSGEYLSGSYLGPLPEGLRGLKVVLSPTVTSGKAVVMDSSQFELLVVDDLTVEIGTDGSDFTTNVRTILGEMRVIPTFRAVGALRLITPKAA